MLEDSKQCVLYSAMVKAKYTVLACIAVKLCMKVKLSSYAIE